MLKGIILWKYERASRQWDLLCFLIILFIFLTPKTWFDRKERLAVQNAQLIFNVKSGAPSAEIIKLSEQKAAHGETFDATEVR